MTCVALHDLTKEIDLASLADLLGYSPKVMNILTFILTSSGLQLLSQLTGQVRQLNPLHRYGPDGPKNITTRPSAHEKQRVAHPRPRAPTVRHAAVRSRIVSGFRD